MSTPRYKRYLKSCDNEFLLCSEIGESDVIVAEHSSLRDTLYQIIVSGTGRVGKCFDNEYLELSRGVFDVKKFRNEHTNFLSYEPFHMYGFNALDRNSDWEGEEIKESFTCKSKGYLICFDGHPVVNGKRLERLDYSLLKRGTFYNVDIKDGLLAFFYKTKI